MDESGVNRSCTDGKYLVGHVESISDEVVDLLKGKKGEKRKAKPEKLMHS